MRYEGATYFTPESTYILPTTTNGKYEQGSVASAARSLDYHNLAIHYGSSSGGVIWCMIDLAKQSHIATAYQHAHTPTTLQSGRRVNMTKATLASVAL